MTSDLCTDDVVVHIGGSQIISSETAVTSCSSARAAGGGGGGGAELGRRLLLAARGGDTAAVLDLMAKGTPFTTDWLGTSPLHLAAGNGHAETCAVLLRAGVSRDSRTKVDRTPLHLAAYEGHEGVVSLLVQQGALVDCRDMLRMTPLHWAAQRGHAAAARELLRRGADPLAVSKFGATPVSLARRSQPGGELARLLEEAARAREAARSVRALVSDQNLPETQPQDPPLQPFETVQGIQENDTAQKQTNLTQQQHHEKVEKVTSVKIEQPAQSEGGGGGGGEGEGGGEGAAAQLLRRHGITLLPADDGTTVLSALQSGRSVVLSDAGKLMLKESGEKAAVTSKGPPLSGGGKGMVLTATAVKSPPRAGVKIFTLNNKVLVPADSASATATASASVKRLSPSQNLQVKYVQLPAESGAGAGVRTVRGRRGGGSPRPVKIILNRANFTKLLSPLSNTATVSDFADAGDEVAGAGVGSAGGSAGAGAVREAENVLRVSEEWVSKCSQKELRAHTLHARRALGALLRQYRAGR